MIELEQSKQIANCTSHAWGWNVRKLDGQLPDGENRSDQYRRRAWTVHGTLRPLVDNRTQILFSQKSC